MDLKLHLIGTKKLLMHNGRLANPLDPYTRSIKQISKKRSKTDADLNEMVRLESRAAMYETSDGMLGLPTQNIWRSIFDAAKAYKLGEPCKRALLVTDVTEVNPIHLSGELLKADTYLDEDVDERLLYVSARVGTGRVMRARPVVPAGWQVMVTLQLLEEELQPSLLTPVYERAGQFVGVGDWRPVYGTYELKVAE